jgi:hypothetical protein
MTERPTKEQIDAAMQRAADAARELTRYPDCIAEFSRGIDVLGAPEDGWFHIGPVGVVAEPEQ